MAYLSRNTAHGLLALILAAAATCIIAAYNGSPLLYTDSFYYLRRALAFVQGASSVSVDVADYQQFQVAAAPAASNNPFFLRPAPYTVFLLPFANVYLIYLVPFVQGLLVAYLVSLALRVARIDMQPKEFVLLFLLLSLGSSLPWISGQIMPDIFTGMVILLFFILMFGGNHLNRLEKVFLALLLTGAISTHLSHLPLFIGLVVVCATYWLLFDRKVTSVSNFAGLILGPVIMAALLLAASNYVFTKKITLSESSDLFYLARLAGDGTAQDYLRETCSHKPYLLCAEMDNMPRDAEYFLWDPNGPWSKYQDVPEFMTEAKEIVRGTLRSYPLNQAQKSAENFLEQLVRFEIDHHLKGQVIGESMADRIRLLDNFGGNIRAVFEDSRVVRQDMALFNIANKLQMVVVLISVLILGVSLPFLIVWRERVCLLFIAVVVTGLLGNAFVLSALSMVADRYQNRVIWLLPLAAFFAVWQISRRVSVLRSKPICPTPSQM
jgi:hypothetical protein